MFQYVLGNDYWYFCFPGESDDVPSWKAEIQLRRRSKVFIPSQKPEQPIRLVETPKWKLDLAERTKNKKDPDVPKVCQENGFSRLLTLKTWTHGCNYINKLSLQPMTEILTQTTTPQPHATPPSVPPWQQELAERKKRNSLNPRGKWNGSWIPTRFCKQLESVLCNNALEVILCVTLFIKSFNFDFRLLSISLLL